ncbi:Fc.00g058650.m01.CDS01 [Cosmosporella sp. VM-42]
MARIYEEARRVVVFLGEEFVNLELSRHPQRLKLQDWTRSPDKNNQEREHREHWKVDLHKLLRQKYFSRVWVIQELVLSRQIAIQLGDIEFWADSLTPQALQSAHPDWKWENTPAPWVENIAQRELLKRDIYDILRATSGSKSSDPRDRIFGVNALLGASQDKLPPNYSLSCLHVFLGTFAYLILNMRHTELLYSAAGMSAWNSYPSWMPDWKSSGQDWVFQEVSLEAEAPHDELFYHWWSKHRRPENNSQHVFCVSSENRRWKTSDELYKDRKIQNTGWDSCTEIHVLQFSEPITHDELALRKTRPWYRGARVDAATGSLSINLIHLLKFRAVPENIKISKKYSSACKIFEVKVGGKQTALAVMYIITEGFDLGLILPGSDHLFILDEGRGYCLFLIMREAETSGTFRLLTCCYQVWFQTKPANWVRRSNYTTFDRYAYESTSHTKERECERRDEKLFLADLQGDFVGILQCIYFEAMFRQEEQDLIDTIFPGVENQRDVISAFQGLLNEQRGAAPGFLQSYARCFRFDYHPKIQGEHVELMILPDKWMAMHEPRFTSAYTEVFKEWRFWNGSWSKSSLVSVSMFRKQKPIYIRASKSNIERVAVKTQAYQDLSSLTRAYNLTSEMEMDFYKQKDSPRETDGLFPNILPPGTRRGGMTRARDPITPQKGLAIQEFDVPALPLFVYIHGSGFVTGGLETDDSKCRAIALEIDIVIVNVEYRLAPENKFPVVSLEGQKELETDLTKGFILGGTSAGANFAAGIAHLALQKGPSHEVTGIVVLAGSFCHPDVRPEKYRERMLRVDEINDAPGLIRKSINYFASDILSSLPNFTTLHASAQGSTALFLQTSGSRLFFSRRMRTLPRRRTSRSAAGILDATKLRRSPNYFKRLGYQLKRISTRGCHMDAGLPALIFRSQRRGLNISDAMRWMIQ